MKRLVLLCRPVLFLFLIGLLLGCPDQPHTEPPEPSEERESPIAEGIFAPMGEILPFATPAQRETFERGRELAIHPFTPEEGLGPRFNVTSCAACHLTPVVGGVAGRYRNFFLVGQELEDGTFLIGPRAGILHTYGVEPFAPQRPPLAENIDVLAQRSPIPLFGMGLIAEIYEESILANADPDDKTGNGISGRPNFDRGFVGRFGRKAQTVDIEGFVRGPIFNHMGLTTDPLPDELRDALPVPSGAAPREEVSASASTSNSLDFLDIETRRQPQAAPPSDPLVDDDLVPDPELGTEELFALISFSMLLAAPMPSEPTEESLAGEALFHEIGCADCHIPALEGPRGMIPLYSDLLLHDMGPDLADGIRMGMATGSEFRTQPLWGVAVAGPWLHDGRADTLDEAIRWHGGEGTRSREAYRELSDQERSQIITFLESLGGEEVRTEGSILASDPLPQPGELGGPLEGLSSAKLDLFYEGRHLFDRNALRSEGLGDPSFNSDSCRSCHLQGAIGGAGPLDIAVQRYGTWVNEENFLAPPDGTLLPRNAISGAHRREAAGSENTFELRASPSLLGLGLLELVDEETLLLLEDPDDLRGDGIRGRISRLEDGRIGRFGWKADIPSLREFVRDALSNELGQTVPFESDFTFGFTPLDSPPDRSIAHIDALTFFLENLAPPPSSLSSLPGEEPHPGKEHFHALQCSVCHIPELATPAGPARAYTDLLLHDIAPPGYRGVPTSNASGREFRTPPLWGLRHNGPYMHDGLATTIEDAILRHHNTASSSREAYLSLTEQEQLELLDFLERL